MHKFCIACNVTIVRNVVGGLAREGQLCALIMIRTLPAHLMSITWQRMTGHICLKLDVKLYR
jgi:hypothetical protein